MSRRPWTRAEDDRLRAWYALPPADRPALADMARMLGSDPPRTPEALGQHAKVLRIADRHFTCHTGHLRRIRELHAEGYSDQEIAEALGTNRVTIRKYRRDLLSLPANTSSPRRRARIAAMTREQCAVNGLGGLVELKNLSFRLESVRAGWPPEAARAGRRVLDALEAAERPLSGREVREAVGYRNVPRETLRALEGLGLIRVVERRPDRLGGALWCLGVGRRKPGPGREGGQP
jgi:hypothetical protein